MQLLTLLSDPNVNPQNRAAYKKMCIEQVLRVEIKDKQSQ